MIRFIYLLFIFLLSQQQCSGLQYSTDYYWKDFLDGEVPRDAVVAGQNANGKNIYIGQAFVKGTGLITCEIFSGVKEVYVPMDGIKTIKDNIKILCGPQQDLYWAETNSGDLPSLLMDHVAVVGGHEYATWEANDGVLYVGRAKLNGNLKIGKIVSYYSHRFLVNNNMTETEITGAFEVLLVKK